MRIFTVLLLLAILPAAGCKKDQHKRPPVEKVSLAIRFFHSMEKGDSGAAVRQGQNLLALDNSQNNVRTMITIQESNHAISDAQKLLDNKQISAALRVIDRALKDAPGNYALLNTRAKLRQLRNAGKLFSAMQRAGNAAAMTGARSAAETGLSQNITPELLSYFREYAIREKNVAVQERKNTQASLEAASSAAEKAKAEDARREAENLAFMNALTEKSEAGEKMRKDAGGVPFEPTVNAGEKK